MRIAILDIIQRLYFNGKKLLGVSEDSTAARSTDLLITEKAIKDYVDTTVSSAAVWGAITGTITAQTDLVSYIAGLGYITASSTNTLTNKTWNGNVIAAIYGGTGWGSYTAGDMLYAFDATTLAKLSIGTTGQVLTVVGGTPAWAAPPAGNNIYNSNGTLTSNRTLDLGTALFTIGKGSNVNFRVYNNGNIWIGNHASPVDQGAYLSIHNPSTSGTETYYLKLQSGFHTVSKLWISLSNYTTIIRSHMLDFMLNNGTNKVLSLLANGAMPSGGGVTFHASSIYYSGTYCDFGGYPVQAQAGFFGYASHPAHPFRYLTPNGYGNTGGTSIGVYGNTQVLNVLYTGSVAIGTLTDVPSSILTLQSTSKGILIPRMMATEAEAISAPADGLLIYSKDGSGSVITTKGFWYNNGTTWVPL